MSAALTVLAAGFLGLAHLARRRGDWFAVALNLFTFACLVWAIGGLP